MLLRRLPLFLILILSIGVLPGKAQSRRAVFSIGGSLRDGTDHHAMESVLVTLKLLTGSTVNTAFTRANGDFQFDGLANGDYILEVVVKDYEPVRETISIAGTSHLGLSYFLSKTSKAASSGKQMSISAHQLSVPRKAHEEYEKGMTLIYLKSDYQGALAQFQLAIKDFPTYYEAYAEQGAVYYQLKDLAHAEESLQKAVDLSSGQYPDAMFTLAAILTDTKRYNEAETLARRGMTEDSSSWRGPFELARALNALKQPEEAETNAKKSRDLMPDNPPVYLLLANIHIQRKDYPALIRDLDDYLRLSPGGTEADQARRTKERVQSMMDASKKSADDDDSDQNATDTDADSDTTTPRKASPDTSGLPSLPPPTGGNQ
jgi:tetratricopeptide (TPR) repeat protein